MLFDSYCSNVFLFVFFQKLSIIKQNGKNPSCTEHTTAYATGSSHRHAAVKVSLANMDVDYSGKKVSHRYRNAGFC